MQRLLAAAPFPARAWRTERTRERTPLDWASTQVYLASVLVMLGERQAETDRLEEAVSAFRLALQELTRERVPLQWAQTQMSASASCFRHWASASRGRRACRRR